MNYEIVTLKEKKLIGKSIQTSNEDPQMSEKIGQLWCDFMQKDCGELGCKPDSTVYGGYTSYILNDMSYDAFTACESENCPEGFTEFIVPAGKYAKFSFRGHIQKAVQNAWREIWQIELPRAMKCDIEEYTNCDNNMHADISIYIGLADICQSCGMPMTLKDEYGTQADGTPNTEYCMYCYKDGDFSFDCTMEEMIDHCLNLEDSASFITDKEVAREQMLEYFPSLKRWSKW